MSEIKSLILKELSTYHRDGLIKHTHNYFKSKQLEEENRKSEESKPMEKQKDKEHKPECLKSLYFYVDCSRSHCQNNASSNHQRSHQNAYQGQKQAISKKITDMKGSTRLRFIPDKTDYIVVDHEYFSQNVSNHGINSGQGNYGWTKEEQAKFGGASKHSTASYQQQNTWINQGFISEGLQEFLNQESKEIYELAQKILQGAENLGQQKMDIQGTQNHLLIADQQENNMFQGQYQNKFEGVVDCSNNLNDLQGNAMRKKYSKNQESGSLRRQKDLQKTVSEARNANLLIKYEHGLCLHRGWIQWVPKDITNFDQNVQCQFNNVQSKIIDVKDLDYAIEFMYSYSNSQGWFQDRSAVLHPDYPKVQYNDQQYFIISKVDFNYDLQSKSISRIQKQQILSKIPDQERQCYHQFNSIADKMKESNPSIVPANQEFDIYKLNLKCPKGVDPCMKFEDLVKLHGHAANNLEKYDHLYRKQQMTNKILLQSETEGVLHERIPPDQFPMPKPQPYHTYCQICNVQYENFDDHVNSDSHLKRAKNQAQIFQIDELINEMNIEEKWIHKWPADPVKSKSEIVYEWEVKTNGKIVNLKKQSLPTQNVASRKTQKLLQSTQAGRKSGRASATGVKDISGKASRTSAKLVSGKSSVTRSQKIYQQLKQQQILEYQERKDQQIIFKKPTPKTNIFGIQEQIQNDEEKPLIKYPNQQSIERNQGEIFKSPIRQSQSKRVQKIFEKSTLKQDRLNRSITKVDNNLQEEVMKSANEDSSQKEESKKIEDSDENVEVVRRRRGKVTPYYPRKQLQQDEEIAPIRQLKYDQVDERSMSEWSQQEDAEMQVDADNESPHCINKVEGSDDEASDQSYAQENTSENEEEEESDEESKEEESELLSIENSTPEIMKSEQEMKKFLHQTEAPKKLDQQIPDDQNSTNEGREEHQSQQDDEDEVETQYEIIECIHDNVDMPPDVDNDDSNEYMSPSLLKKDDQLNHQKENQDDYRSETSKNDHGYLDTDQIHQDLQAEIDEQDDFEVVLEKQKSDDKEEDYYTTQYEHDEDYLSGQNKVISISSNTASKKSSMKQNIYSQQQNKLIVESDDDMKEATNQEMDDQCYSDFISSRTPASSEVNKDQNVEVPWAAPGNDQLNLVNIDLTSTDEIRNTKTQNSIPPLNLIADNSPIDQSNKEALRLRPQKNSEAIPTVSPVKASLSLRDKSTKEQSSPLQQQFVQTTYQQESKYPRNQLKPIDLNKQIHSQAVQQISQSFPQRMGGNMPVQYQTSRNNYAISSQATEQPLQQQQNFQLQSSQMTAKDPLLNPNPLQVSKGTHLTYAPYNYSTNSINNLRQTRSTISPNHHCSSGAKGGQGTSNKVGSSSINDVFNQSNARKRQFGRFGGSSTRQGPKFSKHQGVRSKSREGNKGSDQINTATPSTIRAPPPSQATPGQETNELQKQKFSFDNYYGQAGLQSNTQSKMTQNSTTLVNKVPTSLKRPYNQISSTTTAFYLTESDYTQKTQQHENPSRRALQPTNSYCPKKLKIEQQYHQQYPAAPYNHHHAHHQRGQPNNIIHHQHHQQHNHHHMKQHHSFTHRQALRR